MRDEIHEAEAAVIGIDDARAVFHVEDDVVVALRPRHAMVKEAGGTRPLRSVDGETARHAQMHDEDFLTGRPQRLDADKNVFRATVEARNAAARQPLGEARRQGKAQVRPSLRHMRDPPAFKHGRQAPADGFDFRQFRHGFPLGETETKVAPPAAARHELIACFIPAGVRPAGSSACLENGLWSRA